MKGTYKFKTGHTDTSAYLEIVGLRMDVIAKGANVAIGIYRNQTTATERTAEPEVISFNIKAEAQPIKDGEEVVCTIPAFDEVLGVEVLSNPEYNPVAKLYEVIKTFPQFADWE